MDIIFIDSLSLSANLGPDCWGKSRAQPVQFSIYLLFPAHTLDRAAQTDDVADTVHYGHLAAAVTQFVETEYPARISWTPSSLSTSTSTSTSTAAVEPGPGILVQSVARVVVDFLRNPALNLAAARTRDAGVRVVLQAPKYVQLAGRFSVECELPPLSPTQPAPTPTPTPTPTSTSTPTAPASPSAVVVRVEDVVLPVLIGVNAPERVRKQRVRISLVIKESPDTEVYPDRAAYPDLLAHVFQEIETMSYLTLEKFAYQIGRLVIHPPPFQSSTSASASPASSSPGTGHILSVQIYAQKPSAIGYAAASGVEITRTRADYER